MTKFCDCLDWGDGLKAINDVIFTEQARRGFDAPPVYKFKGFEFCPWCGAELMDDENENPRQESEFVEESRVRVEKSLWHGNSWIISTRDGPEDLGKEVKVNADTLKPGSHLIMMVPNPEFDN